MAIWPLAFLFLPALNSIAKSRCYDPFPETECEAQDTELVLWIGIGVVLLASRVACLAYSCVLRLSFNARHLLFWLAALI